MKVSPTSEDPSERPADARVTSARNDEDTRERAPRCGKRLRRWTAAIAVLLGISIAGWLVVDGYRPVALKCLGVVYAIYDPFTHEDRIEFGPRIVTTSRPDGPRIAEQLADWFPRYDFVVTNSPPLPRSIDTVVFQHESLEDRRVLEFLDAAGPLFDAPRDVFDIASRVRSLTEHGATQLPLSENDPLELLRRAQAGQPLTCRPFALLFGACAVEQGYTSRLVGLSKDGRTFDHAVSEVYVPAFGKWVMIDPDFNIAYRRRGVWQNAAEVHDSWLEIRARHADKTPAPSTSIADGADVRRDIRDELELVVLSDAGEPLRERNLSRQGTGIGLEFYEFVVYHARNNFLGGDYPKGHPKRSLQYVVQSPQHAAPPPVCPEAVIVTERERLYFPVGRTEILVESPAEDSTIHVRLGTWTPNFAHFETRTNGGAWVNHDSDEILFSFAAGTQILEVRSVNLAGLTGEIATLAISVTTRGDSDAEASHDDGRSRRCDLE